MKEKSLINSCKQERKDVILSKIVSMIEEIENEGKEICGYVTFVFYPDDGIGTMMENEGILNPAHILEALEAQGIILKVNK